MALPHIQNAPLSSVDPEIHDLMLKEQRRQFQGIELIASENFTSRAVMEALGSCFTNKYSEGLPGARYYGGNEFIDQVEILCQQRALRAFHLDEKEWGVNVQPYSGSPANFAVYTGLLQPHDRIMGLDLPSGGHLTHGYYTAKKKISATSIFFESFPYTLNKDTGYVDYDRLAENAGIYRPKLIICGGSAYPRDWDYSRLKKIADDCGAMLMADIAHISGIIASQLCNNPFEFCDVVTTTTHKTLRGPRAGMIFFRRQYEQQINQAVFPACQGGPHNNTIAAIAVQLKEVATPEFRDYMRQVLKNAEALAEALVAKGYTLVTGGTDNHLVLWDLRPQGLTGSKLETLGDFCNITLNKNSVYGDRSALAPGGVRVGAPAMTSRGCVEGDFVRIAEFLDRAVQLCIQIQSQTGKGLKEFKEALPNHQGVKALKADVEAFSTRFAMPGFDVSR